MTEIVGALTALSNLGLMEAAEAEPHPRLANYKARRSKYKQEERRSKHLQEQKQRRNESFNESRDLIEAIKITDEMGEVEQVDEMEWNQTEKAKHSFPYAKRLMLSEWLFEVPSDLQDLWYLVPCPEGKRSLVIATRGSTKVYSKGGHYLATFPTVLPGGHGQRDTVHGCTVLDCIWHPSSATYYILDVLTWNNQSFLDCETEFRFFWLHNKIQETEGISEKSDVNKYPFILLPHYSCDHETLTTVMSIHPPFPDESVTLDGFLFYHMQCHYKAIVTPLVGWLKPYMVPEILNIPVTEQYLMMKPEGYENLLMYIKQQNSVRKAKNGNKKKSKKKKSKSKTEKMDVTVPVEQQMEESLS